MTEKPRSDLAAGAHRSPPRGRLPAISDIEFKPARRSSDPALLGVACLTVARVVRILSIQVRLENGELLLTYPEQWRVGYVHLRNSTVLPVDFRRTHRAIRRALRKHLGMEEPPPRRARKGHR